MHKYSGKGKIINKGNTHCDVKINSDILGPPGTKGEFIASVNLGQTSKDDLGKIDDTSFREFEVVASLSKKIDFSIAIKGTLDTEDGDSFWLIEKGNLSGKLRSRTGVYNLNANKKNEISTIRFKCKTTSIHKAQTLFFLGINPLLDAMSYSKDIPLIISRVICIDVKYTLTSIIFESPHFAKLIPPFNSAIIEELFPIYALYREYKTNSSSYYKFLCLYKIMEGIYCKLRPNIMKESRKNKKEIQCKKKEIVPDHYLIKEYDSNFVGMKIRDLYDKILTKEFRNAVAHFSLNDGTLLNLTDYNTNRKFNGILFMTNVCCRILINNHIDMYLQLHSLR